MRNILQLCVYIFVWDICMKESEIISHLVVSDSLRPGGL